MNLPTQTHACTIVWTRHPAMAAEVVSRDMGRGKQRLFARSALR